MTRNYFLNFYLPLLYHRFRFRKVAIYVFIDLFELHSAHAASQTIFVTSDRMIRWPLHLVGKTRLPEIKVVLHCIKLKYHNVKNTNKHNMEKSNSIVFYFYKLYIMFTLYLTLLIVFIN